MFLFSHGCALIVLIGTCSVTHIRGTNMFNAMKFGGSSISRKVIPVQDLFTELSDNMSLQVTGSASSSLSTGRGIATGGSANNGQSDKSFDFKTLDDFIFTSDIYENSRVIPTTMKVTDDSSVLVEIVPDWLFESEVGKFKQGPSMRQKWLLGWTDFEHRRIRSFIKNLLPNLRIQILGNLLRFSTTSFEFELVGSDLVIKYSCFRRQDTDRVDPVVNEIYILSKLNHLLPQFTYNLLYYSSALKLVAENSFDKFQQLSSDTDSIKCDASSVSSPPLVRYIITERVGKSLNEFRGRFRNGALNFKFVIKIGIRIIERLRDLHELNIVHGNLDTSNVVERVEAKFITERVFADTIDARPFFHVKRKNAPISRVSVNDLILIDFDQSYEIDPQIDFPNGDNTYMAGYPKTDTSQPSLRRNYFLTPWESTFIKYSFRDDVFRALNIMVLLLYGDSYYQFVDKTLCQQNNIVGKGSKQQRNYLLYKNEENLFDTRFIGGTVTHDYSLSLLYKDDPKEEQYVVNTVSALFANILASVRGTPINERPNYDFILDILTEIELFSGYFSESKNRRRRKSRRIHLWTHLEERENDDSLDESLDES